MKRPLGDNGGVTTRRVPHPFASFAKGWAGSVFTVATGPTKDFKGERPKKMSGHPSLPIRRTVVDGAQ